jgi:hypothetical protein
MREDAFPGVPSADQRACGPRRPLFVMNSNETANELAWRRVQGQNVLISADVAGPCSIGSGSPHRVSPGHYPIQDSDGFTIQTFIPSGFASVAVSLRCVRDEADNLLLVELEIADREQERLAD